MSTEWRLKVFATCNQTSPPTVSIHVKYDWPFLILKHNLLCQSKEYGCPKLEKNTCLNPAFFSFLLPLPPPTPAFKFSQLVMILAGLRLNQIEFANNGHQFDQII